MKKRSQLNYKFTSLIFALILAIGAGEIRAQVCASAPGNLVSWYAGENSALDSRGGNTAILQNGANYATGQVGQAFNFDGSDDLAIIPDSPLYAFGTNSFTIEFWARIDSSNNYNTMITKRAEAIPFDGFNFYRAPNGILGADVKSGGTASLISDSAMQIGQIYHLALVIDRTTNTAKMYVDGVLQTAQPSLSGVGSLTNSEPLRVGRVLNSAANPNPLQAFDGFVDELSIYNRALSTSEIQAIFNAGSTGKCPSATPAPIGLSSWYAGDDSPLDARGGNHLMPQNGANYADGQVGRAFNFDGVDDYYTAPSAPEINFGTGDFSVEYWIKINGAQLSAGREYGLINKNVTYQGNPGWGFELSTEFGNFPNPRIDFFNTISIWNSTNVRATITTDVWHHVVGLRENGVNKLYLDGVLAQTNANTNAAANVDNSQPLLIGGWLGTYFPGQIDEISLYHRALSTSEIQAIFNAGTAGKSKSTATAAPPNQVMWLAGDGNGNDLSGSNNNAAYLQNTTFEVGKVGQSFSLNGTSGYSHIIVPDAPSLEVSNGLTLEAWIKPTSLGSYHQIISKNGDVGNWSYQMGISVNNTLRLDVSGAGGPDYEFVVSPPNAITNNVWTHVAATFNNGAVTLYINGVPVANQTLNITSIYGGGNTNVNIGRDSGSGGIQYFAGQIDEPAIYNRALTASEIASVFNAGLAGKLKITTTTGTTATVGDVSLTYPNAATRRTQQIPLDETDFPALPSGMTSTGLFYDIATDVLPSGTTDLCFDLPSFAALTLSEFNERRILHLENGAWTDRTLSRDFSAKKICARTPSLSPFAIVDSNLAPTAANLSISGRITNIKGNAIARVSVLITDANGATRVAPTNTFGNYRFDEIPAGEIYILSVSHKRYQFSPATQIIALNDATDDVNFTAIE